MINSTNEKFISIKLILKTDKRKEQAFKNNAGMAAVDKLLCLQ